MKLIWNFETGFKNFWTRKKIERQHIHGELSNSLKRNDRRYIKNWWPISLLNVDTKIASKALALRLEKVLPFVVNED